MYGEGDVKKVRRIVGGGREPFFKERELLVEESGIFIP